VFALLVLASEKKNAFPSKMISEVLPVNSVAALALAQHLYRTEKGRLQEELKTAGSRITTEFQDKLHQMSEEREVLSVKIEDQAKMISELVESMSHMDQDSSQYRDELKRVQGQLCGSLALALEDSESRMSRIGKSLLVRSEFRTVEDEFAAIRAVTAEQVGALARKLVGTKLSAAVVGPYSSADELPAELRDLTG